MYELTIADKQHNPLQTNPKHMVGNNFHVGNIRLVKGQWTRVNEWWFLKNQALVKKYVDQGQILVKCPDGSMLGFAKPAVAMVPEQPPVMVAPEPPAPAPLPPPPAPEPEPVREDDFSVFTMKEAKLNRLREVAKTYDEVIALDVAGLVEQVHLTPAQAEKVLDTAKRQLG
jgi:hypothetical protein